MPNMNLDRYKTKLLAEQDRVRAEIEYIEQKIASADAAGGQSELADYDNHPADAGTDTWEKEKDLALLDSYKDVLGKIEEALGKIARGTYGVCDRCGREIAKGRLDAIPYAIYCVECQDIVETR